MQYNSLDIAKIHILRIDPGEDLLLSVRKFLAESGLRQAVVMSGYGTLAAYSLHWVEHNHIPTNNLFRKGEGGIEILAMNGLVVDGKPHIHMALSNPDGAFRRAPGRRQHRLRVVRDLLRGGARQRSELPARAGGGGKYGLGRNFTPDVYPRVIHSRRREKSIFLRVFGDQIL